MITKERLNEIDEMVEKAMNNPEAFGRLAHGVLSDTMDLLLRAAGPTKSPETIVHLINAFEKQHVRATVLMVYATIRTAFDHDELEAGREGMIRFVEACVDDYAMNAKQCIDTIIGSDEVDLGGPLFDKDPNAALREQLLQEVKDGIL